MKKSVLKCFVLAAVCVSALPVTAGASTVRIQEVLYDGIGSDADDVFTELSGTPGLSLDGWSLQGVNGNNGEVYRTLALDGVVIPEDGLLLIATSSAHAGLAAVADFFANVDWQNGPDAVQLWFDGVLMDALQYGDAGSFNAGEGSAASLAAAGESLSRDILGTDTGNNLADFGAGLPSPGVGPAPVPLPAAAWLLLSAIASTRLLQQRR